MSSSQIDLTDFETVAERFLIELRNGESPSVESYAISNEHLAKKIRRLFPILELIETDEAFEGELTSVSSIESVIEQFLGGNEHRRLGDFQILKEIGRGGMGIVYLARQISLGRLVALKLLPNSATFDDNRVARFQREARAAAALHHTNIVPIFEVGRDDGVSYYVMQYINARSMREFIKSMVRRSEKKGVLGSPISNLESHEMSTVVTPRDSEEAKEKEKSKSDLPNSKNLGSGIQSASSHVSGIPPVHFRAYCDHAARMAKQVADGLAHAHSKGVLHRDIKPGNLLIDDQLNVWITDFGLAKSQGSPDITTSGDVIGTLAYMSPEQLVGEADQRSDVFALGLTLYELLALQPAYSEKNRASLIVQVREANPPSLQSLNPEIPIDLSTIVHKCLRQEPGERYQSASDVARELQRFLDGLPILARPVSLPLRFKGWCLRNPLVSGLVSGLILILLLSSGVATLQWHQTSMALAEAEFNWKQFETQSRIAKDALRDAERKSERLEKQSEVMMETLSDVVYRFQGLFDRIDSTERIAFVNKKELLADVFEGLNHISTSLHGHEKYNKTLIWAHLDLGNVYIGIGKDRYENAIADATKEIDRALQLAEEWAEKTDYQDFYVLRILGEALDSKGNVSFLAHETDLAIEAATLALKHSDAVNEHDPTRKSRFARICTLASISKYEFRRFQLQDSLKYIEEANARIKEYRTLYPDDVDDYFESYADFIGMMELIQSRLPDIRESVENAKSLPEPIRARAVYDCSAWVAHQGDHVKASEILEGMEEFGELSGPDRYSKACGYARCVRALLANRNVDELTEKERGDYDKYLTGSIQCLNMAKELGWFENVRYISQLSYDYDLDPIRGTGQFQEFFAEVAGRQTDVVEK